MKNLNFRVDSKFKIGDYEFNKLIGGFDKDSPCLSLRDINNFMNRRMKKSTELILNHRSKFIDNVDIIDLKSYGNSREEILELDFIPEEDKRYWDRMTSVYILSKSGYYKLARIVNDPIFWDAYQYLLDHYFTENPVLSKIDQLAINIINESDKVKRVELLSLYRSELLKPTDEIPTSSELTDDIKIRNIKDIIACQGLIYTQRRWKRLYKEYELRTHKPLSSMVSEFNKSQSVAYTKLRYIHNILKDLDVIYDIATEIYEEDFKVLTQVKS